ncbi:MAG: ABC transporter ATP-binding protein [Candidatus Nanopelagicales bacterium]
MTDGIALHTLGLTKHYGDVQALVDLDLDVRPGEVFGFLGPNGAGKTTMIRTVMDEIRPTAGRAAILGLDCHTDSVEIRRHIGYLPSDLALYPNLTGKDTLTYFANLRGGVDWAYVGQLAERLGAQLDKKVGDLSSGNRQKVGVIAAFMNRPKLLIMDEPSNGLDPLVQREFQTMMREVVAQGASVFLSSHTLSEVQRVADRVGIIRHGKLIAMETVASLRSKGMRKIEFELGSPAQAADFESVPGARDVIVTDHRVQLSFDGTMDTLLEAVTARYALVDIITQEADLEEIFLTYYHDQAANGSAAAGAAGAAAGRGA